MNKGETGYSSTEGFNLDELSDKLPKRVFEIMTYQKGQFDSLFIERNVSNEGLFTCSLMVREYGMKIVNISGLTEEDVVTIRQFLAEMVIEEDQISTVVLEGKGICEVIYDDAQVDEVSFVPTGFNEAGQKQGRGSFSLSREAFDSLREKYEASPYNIVFLTMKQAEERRKSISKLANGGVDGAKAKPKPKLKPKPKPKPKWKNEDDGDKKRKPPSILSRVDTTNLQIRGVPAEIAEEVRCKLNEVAELLRENGGIPDDMTPVEFGKRWREFFRKALDLSNSKGYLQPKKND